MSNFPQKMSNYVAKLIDHVLILIFDGEFVTPATSHMAKYVCTIMVEVSSSLSCLDTLVSLTSPSMERTP